ncbi:MAG: hypothetical protein S4CHLAM37_02060 [Chlamydiia bacterium]|nr:hypothetical protein [Chlamydiia bacterium]
MGHIPASGPYPGILSAVSSLAPQRTTRSSTSTEEKYVVLEGGNFILGDVKQRTKITELTYIASGVLDGLKGGVPSGVNLLQVADGLEALAGRSENKVMKERFLCRSFITFNQVWTNAIVFEGLPFVNPDQSSRFILRDLASHLKEVDERMKHSNDQNFVQFMTLLTCQHHRVREISTTGGGRYMFNHLATDAQIKDVRERLGAESSKEIIGGIETLDLSMYQGELTKEILEVLANMRTLKEITLPSSLKGSLTLTNPSLSKVEVTGSKLTSLDLSLSTDLTEVNVNSNAKLTTLSVHPEVKEGLKCESEGTHDQFEVVS